MDAWIKFYRRFAWLPAIWMMAAMVMAPTAEAQGQGRLGAGGRPEPRMLIPGHEASAATATLTVSAVVVSSMQVALEAEGGGDAMAEAARPGYSSDGRGRMVLVVHQANDGSASYTLLAAMRTPLHDAGRGRNEVAFRQIGDAHANGHRQSLAESGVVFPGDAQGGSRDREAIALIAIPN